MHNEFSITLTLPYHKFKPHQVLIVKGDFCSFIDGKQISSKDAGVPVIYYFKHCIFHIFDGFRIDIEPYRLLDYSPINIYFL